MASKQKWACSICGMSSSRKFSVKRHLDTLHDSSGFIVTYDAYLVGIKEGDYPVRPVPTRAKKLREPNYELIAKEELCREVARQFVKIQFKKFQVDMNKGDIVQVMLANRAITTALPGWAKAIASYFEEPSKHVSMRSLAKGSL